MKNVIVLIHDDDGQEARFQTALDLTRAIDGHLTCVDVADFIILGSPEMGGHLVVQDTRAAEAANRTRLENRLAIEQLPWSWVDSAEPDPAAPLLAAARSADLIVIGGRKDGEDYSLTGTATRLLGKTHALVVAAAAGADGFDALGRALIAWDGSPPAVFAMQRAIPLLRMADAVSILEVGIEEAESSVDEAASYLSRHGIHAEIRRVRQSTDFASTIRMEAKAQNAAYCLMGAYHHRPISEAFFGGVTRAMLGHTDLTLVLGH